MIGRIEEKRQLQQLLNEEESQFVAVFGRRRIGKTFNLLLPARICSDDYRLIALYHAVKLNTREK